MAQLIKRPSSKFYYARFQVNGKDRWLSTGETDSKKARKQLIQLQAQARNEMSIEEQLTILMDLIKALPLDVQPAKRQEVVRTVLQGQEKKLELEQAWEKWKTNPNKEYDPKPKTFAELKDAILARKKEKGTVAISVHFRPTNAPSRNPPHYSIAQLTKWAEETAKVNVILPAQQ